MKRSVRRFDAGISETYTPLNRTALEPALEPPNKSDPKHTETRIPRLLVDLSQLLCGVWDCDKGPKLGGSFVVMRGVRSPSN